jgi:hypothetical protein
MALHDPISPDNISSEGVGVVGHLAGITAGSHTIIVTAAGGTPASIVAAAVSYSHVSQATPVAAASNNFGSSTGTTITTSSQTNNMVVDFVIAASGVTSASGTGHVQDWLNNSEAGGTVGSGVAMGHTVGATSVVSTWTVTNDDWGVIALNVNHD